MKSEYLKKYLRSHGCIPYSEGKKHTKWLNTNNREGISTVPRHKEIDDRLAQDICKQLRVPIIKT